MVHAAPPVIKSSDILPRHTRHTRILFILSLLVYWLLMFATKEKNGTAILAFLPIATASACWGWRGGLIAGLCAFPVNALTLAAFGIDWRPGMLSPIGLVGHLFLLLQGLLVGFVIDLYKQRVASDQSLKNQIQQNVADLERAQAAERQLEAVLEQSADGIHLVDLKNKTIVMVNQAFLDMVGMFRDELIDKEPYVFMPEIGKTYQNTLGEKVTIEMQYYEDNHAIQQQLFTVGRIKDWQYDIVSLEGKLVPIEANVTTLLDNQGQPIGAISVVRDITGRKLAERELLEATDYLDNVIENSPDSIILADSGGYITRVNRAGLEMLGYSLEEMIGKAVMEFFTIAEGYYKTAGGDTIWLSNDEINTVYWRMAEFLEAGKLSNYASYLRHKNGTLVEVEHNLALLYDQQGQVSASVAITRDRSMRNRMERELSRQADLLSQANRELESFAYSVSHDLRAPLRSISGFSTALTEDYASDLPDEARGYLQRIQKAATRMDRLIDDILNLSRVSRYGMQRKQIDLSAVAAKVIAQMQEQTPERTVTCTIEPGITTWADGHLLRIMLENLLANAWKYTEKQAEPEISFGRAGEDNHRPPDCEPNAEVFCVRDNGVGFDMNYADKLFSPFQRLHAEKDFPGTGIGLATVQRIIRRHGGHVWAYSTPGKGAAFYFTL